MVKEYITILMELNMMDIGKTIYKVINFIIHKEGHGVETWTDGSKYDGHYKEGKKHGKGNY